MGWLHHSRQGEAILLVDLMGNLGLQCLLPKDITTYSSSKAALTIDPIFSTDQLTEQRQQCRIHSAQHESDHKVIETSFSFDTIVMPEVTPRRLFKSAPWKKICDQISAQLEDMVRLLEINLNSCIFQLLSVVQKAVDDHVPIAKPSQYAKRWWTKDLTKLRKDYTCLRNQAARLRRQG